MSVSWGLTGNTQCKFHSNLLSILIAWLNVELSIRRMAIMTCCSPVGNSNVMDARAVGSCTMSPHRHLLFWIRYTVMSPNILV